MCFPIEADKDLRMHIIQTIDWFGAIDYVSWRFVINDSEPVYYFSILREL